MYHHAVMNDKTCIKCGETKNLDDFYKNKQNKDGYTGKCKECTKAAVKVRVQNFTPEQKIARRKTARNHMRRRRATGWKDPKHKQQKKDPHKILARGRVYEAIRSGKMNPEPCAVCGNECSHAHHEDYTKPLDVTWLCSRHHHDRHIHLGELSILGKQRDNIKDWLEDMKRDA